MAIGGWGRNQLGWPRNQLDDMYRYDPNAGSGAFVYVLDTVRIVLSKFRDLLKSTGRRLWESGTAKEHS